MKKEQKPPVVSQNRARVTSISVSRLYNTGNYTNARYDLNVEIPPGVSANETFREVTAILGALRPLVRPSAIVSLENARNTLFKDLSDYQKQHMAEWEAEEKEYLQRKQLQDDMLKRLDDLGGTETYTDAKQNWEDDCDVPY